MGNKNDDFIKPSEINLHLRLDPNESWQRIASESEPQAAFINPSKPFVYKISGEEMIIEKVRYYRNSFAASLRLKIYPADFGSVLIGYFEANNSILPLIIVPLILLGIFIWLWFGNFFAEPATGQSLLTRIVKYLVPLLAIFGIFTMYPVGRFLAEREKRKIIQWLEKLFSDSIIE